MASPDPDNGFHLVSRSEGGGGVDAVDKGGETDSVENGKTAPKYMYLYSISGVSAFSDVLTPTGKYF